uniref:von Willebrand factor type D domain protein n=1 Tax=uncultured eukaryote TaxID=100272 RepID=A0A2R4LVJ5_9EUKA|nr:von Willebrand factor type D domain protein [uncultured eukaryote]
MWEQLREYVQDDEDQAQCSITSKSRRQGRSQVETFDGTKFSAPFTNCWVVLAKDCGSQQPKFVVMARKSERGQDLKEVKIVTKKHRIQLTPDSAEYNSVKVQVNGQQYDPESDQQITENGQVVQIEKDQSTVQVQLPNTGLEVEFDGYAINIQLSQAYRGQQCGLCGHFDLESTDEFRNPDFTDEQDIRQFYMNYLIKDGQCKAPQQLTEVCESEECDKADRSSSSSSSSSSSGSQESQSNEESEIPEKKTKVIEIDDQLCFSTVPIPQCDEEDSYPMGEKEKRKVAYVCIDQDSQEAEDIERQARSGRRQIPALNNRTPSFTRTEKIPEKCKKYSRN